MRNRVDVGEPADNDPRVAKANATPSKKELGARIKNARAAAGFDSQPKFAAAVGVHLQTVNRWETGKTYPDPPDLVAICRTTGYSLDQLILGVGRTVAQPEVLVKFWQSPEGAALNAEQRLALATLCEGRDVDEWRLRAMLEMLVKAPEEPRKKAR